MVSFTKRKGQCFDVGVYHKQHRPLAAIGKRYSGPRKGGFQARPFRSAPQHSFRSLLG